MKRKYPRNEDYYEEDTKEEIKKEPNIWLKSSVVCCNYVYFLDDSIEEVFLFRDFYKLCEEASENDTITIVINCSGGIITSLVQIINSILNAKAKTIAQIYYAYSSAFYIALACDEIEVMKNSVMMVHSISFNTSGKVTDIKDQTDMLNFQNEKLLKDIGKRFLTKEEINKVLEGRELYFEEEEILKRCHRGTK